MTTSPAPASTRALTQPRITDEPRPSVPAAPVPRLITPLTEREPGTPDYELARTLLDEQFPDGHTAMTLLYGYRERDLDLSVESLRTATGVVVRLVVTTGFTPLTAPERAGIR